jgi:hypothetical protein
MGVSDNWQDQTYQRVFEEERIGLLRRRQADRTCSVADLEGVLRSLYQSLSDWGGDGEIRNSTLAATIAAYEQVIAEWKNSAP